MGYIVKGEQRAQQAMVLQGGSRAQPSDDVAAEATSHDGESELGPTEPDRGKGWHPFQGFHANVLSAARAAADAQRTAVRDAAVLLARKMAEKIVGHAVDLDPTVMADIVAQALAASRADGVSIVLRVHPDDLTTVESSRPRWIECSQASNVRLVGDASVGRYGCVVETPAGRVDGRLRTQLDLLERMLGGGKPRS